MKFFKGLIILYLVWAVGYSMVAIPPWVGDALAFKSNGGFQVIDPLERAGFTFAPDIAGAKQNSNADMPASPAEDWGVLRIFWGARSSWALEETIRGNKPYFSAQYGQSGKNWAVWLATDTSETKTVALNKLLEEIQIDLKKPEWHPLTEFRFLVHSIPILDSNKFLHFPPLGFPVVILIFSTYPVYYSLSAFYAAIIAFFPPVIVGYSVFLPPLLVLIFVGSRINRKKRQQPRNP